MWSEGALRQEEAITLKVTKKMALQLANTLKLIASLGNNIEYKCKNKITGH